jgi:MFS superfamily sulfate permease-like transporter
MSTLRLLLIFFIDVAIGVTSYCLVAGGQTDWSQLITYVWILFWPFVILLGLFYYSPITFLAVFVTVIFGWRIARRCG